MSRSKIFDRQPEEDFFTYRLRLCENKHVYSLTWNDISILLNSCLDNLGTYSASYYRKHYNAGDFNSGCSGLSACVADNSYTVLKGYKDELKDDLTASKIAQIQMERMKLSDERVQNNALLRRIAREDVIKEMAKDAANRVSTELPFVNEFKLLKTNNKDKAGILQISDWHYGVTVESSWNSFNPLVAKNRISQLTAEVINIIRKEKISQLYVVNLGDMIAGSIHLTIRLNSRINVLDQIMQVSEMIAEMLFKLSVEVDHIDYYDTLDNHSRLDPIKENSLELESLCRITTWFLDERFKDCDDITINTENEFASDIATFNVLGHDVAGVHGHKDKPEKVVDNVVLMTKRPYSLVLTSHLHHFSADEKNEVLVLSNGSLMGTDSYAEKLRLSAKPSQNLIIATPDNVAKIIYRIVLN